LATISFVNVFVDCWPSFSSFLFALLPNWNIFISSFNKLFSVSSFSFPFSSIAKIHKLWKIFPHFQSLFCEFIGPLSFEINLIFALFGGGIGGMPANFV
jgi:hypothetical protein